jgi:tetratricopeptide (TPR) repeat protein
MADETESPSPGAAAEKGPDAQAAMALSLGGASRAKADSFLDEQRAVLGKQGVLLDLQIEDAREQHDLHVSHLRFRRFGDYTKAAMEATVALFIALIVLGLGAMIWQAHEAGGLVAEPLKTPPDFAAKGLDGTVLSQELLDRLNAMVTTADAYSLKKPDSIAGSWGSDIKVQIPDTGISIDELSRLLRGWLGHETRVSGEITRSVDGIALTVRAGAGASRTFRGRESDLDALIDKAANALLRETQPFVYLNLLTRRGDLTGSIAVARELTAAGSNPDRSYGYSSWASDLALEGKFRQSIAPYARSIALAPDDPMGPFFATNADAGLDHGEAFVTHAASAALLFATVSLADYRPETVSDLIASAHSMVDQSEGDFADAVRNDRIAEQYNFSDYDVQGGVVTASDLARDHDVEAARAVLADHPQYSDGQAVIWIVDVEAELPFTFVDADVDDWKGVAASLSSADRMALLAGTVNDPRHTLVWPWLAYALAKTGDITKAEALVRMTPLDCTRCLEFRGRVAELAGDYSGAARWFARAAADAPSEPFATTDWGAMLLHRGDFEGAIAKFEIANKKGPHFADPLEMWGEALINQNRSDLAPLKFAEASKYAPNWGRLHLKWGEALLWSGDKPNAQKQFAMAATLDLTPSEKSELAHIKGMHG